MIDRKRFRRKLMFHLANSPATLVPLAAGTGALVVGGLVIGSPLLAFGGLVGVLGGLGTWATRAFMGSEKTAQRVIRELEAEARRERERELDRLEQRLLIDGDPRNERLLRDLRRLSRPFHEGDALAGVASGLALDITFQVDQLFEECRRMLEQSLELWQAAQGLTTRAAAEPVLRRRERLLVQVAESVEQLGRVLGSLQSLDVSGRGEGELERVRHELDQSLELARGVEQELRALDAVQDDQMALEQFEEAAAGARSAGRPSAGRRR